MATRRFPPGTVRLVFPPTRPRQVNPLTGEPENNPAAYDPHIQADVAQFQQARGDAYTYGIDQQTAGASPDFIPGAPGTPGAPGAPPAPGPSTMPNAVIEPDRFHRTARTPWTLTASSVLVLPAAAPATPRVFLYVLNKTASAGIVYLDFDNSAAPLTAPVELQPGGVAFFDQFIPQGDLYAAAGTTAFILVMFANGP